MILPKVICEEILENKDKAQRNTPKLVKCPKKCGKSFVGSSGVSHHVLLAHTPKEAWPFTCPFCQMKLTQKCDKIRHMKLRNHKNHIGFSMPEIGSKAWNDLVDEEEHKFPKIKDEKVSNVKIEKIISTKETNSKQLPDSPKDHLKSDKVMTKVKQECVIENYEARKEENDDPLTAVVDRIDNNEDITIDEMLIAIEKICAS